MSETSTIGIVNYINGFQLADGSIVNINLIDTAGQEKFKSIVLRYYSKADCCLLVYDISDSNTFDEIKVIIIQISKLIAKKILKLFY